MGFEKKNLPQKCNFLKIFWIKILLNHYLNYYSPHDTITQSSSDNDSMIDPNCLKKMFNFVKKKYQTKFSFTLVCRHIQRAKLDNHIFLFATCPVQPFSVGLKVLAFANWARVSAKRQGVGEHVFPFVFQFSYHHLSTIHQLKKNIEC